MRLNILGERVYGDYFYQRFGEKLNLIGKVTENKEISLENFSREKNLDLIERNPKGEETGLLKVRLRQTNDSKDYQLEGDFQAIEAREKLQVLAYRTARFSLPSVKPELVLVKIKPKTTSKITNEGAIKLIYPELESPKLNKIVTEINKVLLPNPNLKEAAAYLADSYFEGAQSLFYQTDYSVEYLDENYLSLRLVTTINSGGAHPNSGIETKTFDLKTGKQIELNNLFTGSEYLNKLSNFAGQDLEEQFLEYDANFNQEGLNPNLENFKSYNLNSKGLLINFQAYQIGPYALGTPQVLIPWSALDADLAPEFQQNFKE